ncbi:hypothetical protein CUJ83_04135 [Methanocella sp. CWC-04]|uniref:Uncharacterized protein n=1 Tax=Methanooceanicella nereidis TaxID=2052831 RepID=A0AAP2RB68_9EURY|nr:glycosyltransferase family 4 protein [Methanocella sp. CWC-04]MCD1294183.1 hypothetical protein [Methanocella sp. CWC-04]
MKVAIVVPYFTPFVRGNEFELATWLARQGIDVTVLTSKGKAPREKMVLKDGELQGSQTFRIKYLPTVFDVGEIPFTPTVFLEVLKGGYDALLLQEDYQSICHLAYIAARIKKIPTVLSTERTYHPENYKRNVLGIFDATFNKMVRNGTTVYTAHCRAARDFMQSEIGVAEGRMRVIPIGVDTRFFKPYHGDSPLTEGEFRILSVARLHPYKGLDHLIRAMSIVKKECPGAMLYLKGRGPSEKDLKALVSELNLGDSVRFLDKPLPYENMPLVYSGADVYVQPSVIEPFGCAVTEAMACGKPTICSRIGGMMDTVEDGVTGYLVAPANHEEIAEKLIRMVKDRAMLNRMGDNARKRAEEKFDWSVVSKQYLQIIEDISEHKG